MIRNCTRAAATLLAIGIALAPTGRALAGDDADVPKVEAKQPAAQAERAPPPSVAELRTLGAEEYSRACEDRDQADLRRAAHEKRYPSAPKYPKNNPETDADFAAVVAAFRATIAAYPATQFELDCRLRLAGAYQYRGEFANALDEAKQAAERFANTPAAPTAQQAVALIYLQALHRPKDAEPWFRRMQQATQADPDEQAKWQAAAADGLARCNAEEAAGDVKPKKVEQKQARDKE